MASADYIEHIAIEGERWDTLAWRYYADATRYEPILRANPGLRRESGQWPAMPPAGAKVLIPILPRPAAQSSDGLPPWLQ
jgi:phage tail protein X